MRRLGVVSLVATLAGAMGLAGCASEAADERPNVVVGFYPLQYVAEQVGGDRVSVTNLAQPGAEPHDLELSPQQVAAVADADLVLYLKGFQPELDEAVAQEADDVALDLGTVVELRPGETGPDPHFWLDPTRLATAVDAVGRRLGEIDPDAVAPYQAAADSLRTRLDELDQQYQEALDDCRRREIITSHAAFGYLAQRYDLAQIGITGLSPDVEPTPQRLAEVTAQARQHGATTIFFETLVSPRVAEAIAAEVGAGTAVLDPLEGLPAGSPDDYLSVMRTNLEALTRALDCT